MVVSDRYRLEELVGEGAFSQVYRATDLKDGSGVAMKLLAAESIDAAGLERFRREAELATRLTHPNTIRLICFNLRGRPLPVIVYELLASESLKHVMGPEGRGSGMRRGCACLKRRAARRWPWSTPATYIRAITSSNRSISSATSSMYR